MNRFLRLFLPALLASPFVLTSCSDDDDDNGPDYQAPNSYAFNTVGDNASGEQSALNNLTTIVSRMSSVEEPSETVTYSELVDLYEQGNPSLSDMTTQDYRNQIVNDQDGFFKLLADASVSDTVFVSGEQAGVNPLDSSDFFLEDGREPLQLVEKGLFSAALFNRGAELLTGQELTAADFDKAFVLFGAPANFPNDEGQEDQFGANYVSDRDNEGTDVYKNIREGFLNGRAAVDADAQDSAQVAAQKIVENWERGLAATAVHYCGETIQLLQEQDRAPDAYHAYAEAYAFLGGLSGTPASTINDGQVADLLQQLKEPTTVTTQDLQGVIDELANIYNFQDPTIFY